MKRLLRFLFGKAWGREVKSRLPPTPQGGEGTVSLPDPPRRGRRIIDRGVILPKPERWEW